MPIKMTDVVKDKTTSGPTAPYMIKVQREKRVRMDGWMEQNASFTKNDKIPIKMTNVVKNEAPKGPGGPLHDQGSKGKKGL